MKILGYIYCVVLIEERAKQQMILDSFSLAKVLEIDEYNYNNNQECLDLYYDEGW